MRTSARAHDRDYNKPLIEMIAYMKNLIETIVGNYLGTNIEKHYRRAGRAYSKTKIVLAERKSRVIDFDSK